MTFSFVDTKSIDRRRVKPSFITHEQNINLLKLMLTSEAMEKREAMLVKLGKSRGYPSSRGHEALIAITKQLYKEDYLFPYYRCKHLLLGKGMRPIDIANDFFAKKASSAQGRTTIAGSRELNIFPVVAHTASQCLPAVGNAWAQKLAGSTNITVCSIGDGSTRQGMFYEAVCFALQESLPIIFLIEDNKYAISTKTEKMMPFRLDIFHESIYKKIDGTDIKNVQEISQQVIESVRKGYGPFILWCEVDRLDSHTAVEDQLIYRTHDEIAELSDPIAKYAQTFIKNREISPTQLSHLKHEIAQAIDDIYQQAESSPDPESSTVYNYISNPLENYTSFPKHSALPELTMVEAVNHVLKIGLDTYPNMIVFGQDIEDPKGGVFGFTKGLSQQYPCQVYNAPVAEASMLGTSVGLAIQGFKPVVEIQFIDFLSVGFEQLTTQIASLAWRSCKEWTCPIVMYAPYGAYITGSGPWHSQSNDGWWAHIPGLRIAVPSTPSDVAGLFWTAFQEVDPTLILIPKHIFRTKEILPNFNRLPFGKAKIVTPGEEVTLVTWGNGVSLAKEIINHHTSISVELIDLISLVPCDWDTVENSLQKTGRLVVVHEDNKTCGFGATILAEILTRASCFESLYSAPQLVARHDVDIPCHPVLEKAILPDKDKIIQALRNVMDN